MTVERCPACGQKTKAEQKARLCWDCGQPIATHHKWILAERDVGGQTAVVMVHRHCCRPTSYHRAAENKKIGVVGYKDLTPEQVEELTAKEEELERGFAEWRKENGR